MKVPEIEHRFHFTAPMIDSFYYTGQVEEMEEREEGRKTDTHREAWHLITGDGNPS